MAGSSGATGWLHSCESCAIGDGPGIRFAVFLQGCPLRCRYCHNPDTWRPRTGREVTVEQVLAEIRKYRSYMSRSNGGVTLTGGEPLFQPEFAAELLEACQREGIHTAVDTAGSVPAASVARLLEATDLVLHDLKSIDPEQHRALTGVPLEPVLEFARELAALRKPTWIQHVLVPGITARDDLLEKLAAFVASLGNVEQVVVLPFHKLGEAKWEALGIPYTLAATPPASAEEVARAEAIFVRHGLRVG
jgi:pyruvate formate lyase activating enzyme